MKSLRMNLKLIILIMLAILVVLINMVVNMYILTFTLYIVMSKFYFIVQSIIIPGSRITLSIVTIVVHDGKQLIMWSEGLSDE